MTHHDIDADRFQSILNDNMERYETEDVLELSEEVYYGIENDPYRTVEGAKALAAAQLLHDRLHGE